MVDGEQGTQQKPSPQPETRPAPFPSNSNNDLHVPSFSSSNLVVFGDSINDTAKKVEDSTIIQKCSLKRKHSDNHDDHAEGKDPEKESPSAATSSSLASTSRISAKHSFESPVQSGYTQTHRKIEAASVEGGDQGFSSNDKRKGETQRYNIQGHTQKNEKIYKNDVLEVSQNAKELQVEYKKSISGKSHKTESIMLRSQGSNCRKLGTSDDNPIQQEEQGKKEDGDDEDRNFPAGASFFESDQMRSDQVNIHDLDGDKYTCTQNIQTKDIDNKERLSDTAERHHDSRSSSPHRSDRLQSIPSSPPLHLDISENRNNRNCEDSDNDNTILKEATESQIPIRENTSTKDQAGEERLQKQDTSNDKLGHQSTSPHDQEDDYRTKVRNRARNRRRNAAEQNKKRQEEITRLTKANFELKEKNQAMINELVTLGVDAMTIQIFLNSTLPHSTNQQSSVLVPPPTYNLSPF